MKGTIMGFRTVQYEKDGENKSGVSLKVSYDDIDWFGKAVTDIYIGSDKPIYLQFVDYLRGNISLTELIDMPCEFDYISETKGGKTFSRLANFKLLPEDRKKES